MNPVSDPGCKSGRELRRCCSQRSGRGFLGWTPGTWVLRGRRAPESRMSLEDLLGRFASHRFCSFILCLIFLGMAAGPATLVLGAPKPPGGSGEVLSRLALRKSELDIQATLLAEHSLRYYLANGRIVRLKEVPESVLPVSSALREVRGGLFVTILKDGKVRGCFGSLTAEAPSLAEAVIVNTVRAATVDKRYLPVAPDELRDLRFSVSVTGALRRVSSPYQINPLIHGVFVRSRGGSAVLLPAEARTAQKAFEWARRLAGAAPGEMAEMYVFRTLRLETAPRMRM